MGKSEDKTQGKGLPKTALIVTLQILHPKSWQLQEAGKIICFCALGNCVAKIRRA
jgi:hypothetical protein